MELRLWLKTFKKLPLMVLKSKMAAWDVFVGEAAAGIA